MAAFILSLPFWWVMNTLAGETENFLFWYHISRDPYVLSADLKQAAFEKEVKRAIRQSRPDIKKINIDARAAISIVVEGNRERVLFEKDSQTIYPIASLTKLVIPLVIFESEEKYNLRDKIKISQKAVDQIGESKFKPLRRGEEFSVENLLYIALLESSNDASYALAEATGAEKFVALMNQKVKEIGLKNTFFANPTGLDPDDPRAPINYSTARDMAGLAKHILRERPGIFEITSLGSWEVVDDKGRVRYFIPENTNKLIDEFPQIAGGKTGWTPSARGCLMVVLRGSDKKHYINVVLGSERRFEEMKEIIQAINGI